MAKQKQPPISGSSSVMKSIAPVWKNVLPPILSPLLISCIIFIVWMPMLDNGWVNRFDDDVTTRQNTVVRSFKQLDWETIKQLSKPTDNITVPVTQYTHGHDWLVYGDNARGHHKTSLVLFILTGFLVFYVSFLLSNGNIWVATLVMFFFGFNPMNVEAVAWIAARKDQTMGFMVFSTILIYLGYVKTITRFSGWEKVLVGMVFHTVIIVFFLLAIFSKGMAVMLPLGLIAIDFLMDRTWNWIEKYSLPRPLRFIIGSVAEKIVLFGIMAYMGMNTVHEQNAGGTHVALTNVAVVRGSYGLIWQTIKYFFPYHGWLCAHIGVENPYNKNVALFCVALVLAWVYSLWHFRKNTIYVFGVIFYFVFLAVVQYVPAGNDIMMAERYLYIPAVGLAYILATRLVGWYEQKNLRLWVLFGTLIYISGLIYNTCNRIPVWKNDITLFQDVIQKQPYNPKGYDRVAAAFHDLQDYKSEIAYLKQGIGMIVSNSEFYSGLVRAHTGTKEYDLALEYGYYYLSQNPSTYRSAMMYNQLGIIYAQKNLADSASMMFAKSIQLAPAYIASYGNWARSFLANGIIDSALTACDLYLQVSSTAQDSAEALTLREKILSTKKIDKISPTNDSIVLLAERGLDRFNKHNLRGALQDFNRVIDLDSTRLTTLCNRGVTYAALGKLDNALADYFHCLRITKTNPVIYDNIATVYMTQKDSVSARYYYLKELEVTTLPKDRLDLQAKIKSLQQH